MRQCTRPLLAVFSIAAALALVTGTVACGGSATPNPVAPHAPTITALPSVDEMLSEKIIGNSSAPNTIIEYVAFSSPSSRDFYLTGDGAQMKTQLADTGRAQILFRNLIIGSEVDGNQRPEAVMLARCAGNARFFDAVNTIYQRFSSWVGMTDPFTPLQQVMLGFGMSQSVVDGCLSNSALQAGVIAIHNNAEQATYLLKDGTQRAPTAGGGTIFQVPAVVVNGVLFDGMSDASTKNADFAPTMANITPFLK